MLHTASVQVGAIWFLAVSCMHLKMAIFIPRLPIGLLFHRLLHYVGNAREMDETFCDLFHILKLKASGKKKKRDSSTREWLLLATALAPASRNSEHNIYFVHCVCVYAGPGAVFVIPC